MTFEDGQMSHMETPYDTRLTPVGRLRGVPPRSSVNLREGMLCRDFVAQASCEETF